MSYPVKESILEFLKSRNISDANKICREMDFQKVDVELLAALREDDFKLSQWLPNRNDRMAIIEWSKQIQLKNNNLFKKGPTRILNSHRRVHQQSVDPYVVKPPRISKPVKIKKLDILIGWLHYDESERSYRMVKKAVGGGFKNVKCPIMATSVELLRISRHLFFGRSSILIYGSWRQLNVEMLDFNREIIKRDTTLNDLYVQAGLLGQLPVLKCYLATKKKVDVDSTLTLYSIGPTSTVTSSMNSTDNKSTGTPDTNSQLRRLMMDNFSLRNNATSNNDNTGQMTPSSSTTHNAQTGISPMNQPGRLNRVQPRYLNSRRRVQDFRNFRLEDYSLYFSDENYLSLDFHRGNVFQEMIDAFAYLEHKKGITICIGLLHPNGNPEKAIDSGGVFRDAITEFWNTMYQTCTVGTNIKIPSIRHNLGEEKWRAMAKIFYIGWNNAKYLPIKLAMPILEQILFGRITSELIPVYLQTLSDNDSRILSSALLNIKSVDNNALIEVLSNLQCRVIPNEHNLKETIEQMAHLELVQKPHYIIEQFRVILKSGMSRDLNKEELIKLYKSMEPTAENILKILSRPFVSLNKAAIRTFGYLEKYVKEMSDEMRPRFLRFCTGADLITDIEIMVEFKSAKIFASAPMVQTCTGILTLPSTYENFADFEEEMNNLLSSDNWVMEIE